MILITNTKSHIQYVIYTLHINSIQNAIHSTYTHAHCTYYTVHAVYIQYTQTVHATHTAYIQYTYTVHTTVYTEYIHINQVDKNKNKICKYENKHILFRRWA